MLLLLLLPWRCGDEADSTVIVMITETITMIVMIRALHFCSAVSLSLSLSLSFSRSPVQHMHVKSPTTQKTQFFLFQHAVILNPSVLHIGNSNMAAGSRPYAQTPSNKYSSKKSRLAAARAASLCDPYACFLAGLKVITAE